MVTKVEIFAYGTVGKSLIKIITTHDTGNITSHSRRTPKEAASELVIIKNSLGAKDVQFSFPKENRTYIQHDGSMAYLLSELSLNKQEEIVERINEELTK